jgi:ABC-type transport system involved in cytochrome c biogenesis permease component
VASKTVGALVSVVTLPLELPSLLPPHAESKDSLSAANNIKSWVIEQSYFILLTHA